MTDRIERVRNAMQQQGLASLVVTNPFNLVYLAQFHGLPGDGCLVVTKDKVVLITDSRYDNEMTAILADSPVELDITRDYYGVAFGELADEAGKVGFEDSLNFATYEKLKELFGDRLVVTNNLIETLRYTKDADELVTLKKSCRLADEAYSALLQYIHPGISEREAERFLYDWLSERGASKPSFDTIVVSGERSAYPHGVASDKHLNVGDLVTVDFGFYYHDYTFDMTRTFAIGDPGEELKQAYQVVKEAQQRMIDTMHDGASTNEVDAAARDYIADQGYGEYYGHGGGHGIGLDIHEGPFISPRTDTTLHTNYVMTAEPGIYLPGKGGIRIEDDVLVTADGHELLTHSEKELIIVE
ncbi:M24 family metallopeptidase [Lactobacillaceae bacterium Melli_B3]